MAFTSREYADRMARRANAVTPAVQATVFAFGEALLERSHGHMQRDIYDIPEDVTASGAKKWTRTGKLKEHETLRFAGDGSGVRLTNDRAYARSRHELGRDGRKTNRPAHWRDEAAKDMRGVLPRMLQAMNGEILRGNPNAGGAVTAAAAGAGSSGQSSSGGGKGPVQPSGRATGASSRGGGGTTVSVNGGSSRGSSTKRAGGGGGGGGGSSPTFLTPRKKPSKLNFGKAMKRGKR